MKTVSFKAEIKSSEIGQGGSYIEFPYETIEAFGKKGRIKVKCSFDGEEYRGSLVRMGTECHIVGMRKDILKKIGKTAGDTVNVVIEEDKEERQVAIVEDLNKVFGKDAALKDAYYKLSYTKRKEYNDYISSAKKEETRKGRIEKIINELKLKTV